MGMTFICCYNFLKQIIFSIHGKEVNNKNPQSSKTIVVNRSLLYCEWWNELPEKSQEASKIAAKFFFVCLKMNILVLFYHSKVTSWRWSMIHSVSKGFVQSLTRTGFDVRHSVLFFFFYCGTRIIMWC